MRLFYLLIVLIIGIEGYSQSISGKVTDLETGEPISKTRITVTVKDSIIAYLETDFRGKYRIDNLQPNSYNLDFTFLRYSNRDYNITLSNMEILTLNVELTEESDHIIEDVVYDGSKVEIEDSTIYFIDICGGNSQSFHNSIKRELRNRPNAYYINGLLMDNITMKNNIRITTSGTPAEYNNIEINRQSTAIAGVFNNEKKYKPNQFVIEPLTNKYRIMQ